MRLSELSALTEVSIASLKYYLRESLLPPGEPVTKTQAHYGPAHVDRVRLIRALVDSGGLSLAQVRQIIDALDGPPVPRHQLLGAAQAAMTGPSPTDASSEWTDIAATFVADRGWTVHPDDPLLAQLGVQFRALAESFDAPASGGEALAKWAAASELIAEADLGMITADDSDALKTVVVGTVLSDPVLQTLRRLAQQHLSSQSFDAKDGA